MQADVKTQSLYQMMDNGFVGLIFSAFNGPAANSKVSGMIDVVYTVTLPVPGLSCS